MARNGDEQGGAAVPTAWAEDKLRRGGGRVDEAFQAAEQIELPQNDLAAIDKKVRAVINLVRAVAVVETTARRTAATAEPFDSTEDEMNSGDRPDPETVERYKAELLDRLERHHAIVEAKRVAEDARERRGMEAAVQG